MKLEQKNSIVSHAIAWMNDKGITQSDFAKHAKINPAYLSNILRNVYSIEDTPISDKWFMQIAKTIGFSVAKQYWGLVKTKEFEKIIYELLVAKKSTGVAAIVAETGFGKTYAVERFCQVHPLHTYRVVVNNLYKVRDILNDIAEKMGTPQRYYPIDTLGGIGRKLRDLKMQGHSPIIIIDEAENLKVPQLQTLKGLIDIVTGYASIVLIGTGQLLASLNRLKRKNEQGIPQFMRRIKAGVRIIETTNDFTQFFHHFEIKDKGLQRLLKEMCENYGELHDYLEPALREAGEREQELTEDFFRIMYNLPKFNR